MKRITAALLAGALALLLVPDATGVAQDSSSDDELSPIQKEFASEFGESAVEYWNGHLAEYKKVIDRTLSPTDLDRLNALRVRWSILMSMMMDKMHQQASVTTEESESDTETNVEVEMSLPEGTGDFSEVAQIWMGATMLARDYRSGMDNVKEYVIEDVGTFADKMATMVDQFAEEHKAELEGDSKGAELMSKKSDVVQKLHDVKSDLAKENPDFDQAYTMAIEPFIMLYNGGDLRSLVSFMSDQAPSSVPDAVTGLIPEGGVLHQNYPNPATLETSIPFTLAGPSSSTVIDLFDSEGALVNSWDLGSMAAGDHEQKIKLEDLSAGTYLYRLTSTTDAGDRIYSRVMEVVK